MLIDLNQAAKTFKSKQYDVCICGAGPAGITVAITLAKKGKRVALLEGGGLEYSEASQQLYAGKSVGENDFNAVQTLRLRYLGGASNHWAGMCSYFDEFDFENKPNASLPGWPIARKDIFEYFDDAKEILDLPKDAFIEKKTWPGSHFKYFNHAFSPPTRFNSKYIDALSNSKLIDLIIHANLTKIHLKDNLSTVEHLEVTNYKKQKALIKAKEFVLTMGSVANARMLLANNSQLTSGIGNQSNMVGKCFMEHINVSYGRFVVDNPAFWAAGGINLQPKSALMQKHQIGNGVISFNPSAKPVSYGRTKVLKQSLRNLVCKSETATNLSRNLVNFDCEGDGIISSMIEQAPNLNSRITLDQEKDMFGIPRLILDWQFNQKDRQTIKIIGIEAAKELARLGVARVQLADYVLNTEIPLINFSPHAHHMGTTRMAESSKYGVADKNQKVFGTDNLYIAGSSVFSTGGGCNPTFTLVMLASRLGNHLSQV